MLQDHLPQHTQCSKAVIQEYMLPLCSLLPPQELRNYTPFSGLVLILGK